ncbi:MAG: winged helix-turn-helix domain-containing protein [Dehalococcoidales bacterium]|jgi:hypothetical protein|nr:winged helix-turn-helix domain-containing protein [Dehalococcoidales bacterium]MDD5498681.1 winged helix-turn-helix domain-containing protein [Dehalococcoidales bacterium]
MIKIDCDSEVWEALKKNADPFVDTPNDVLRRLLGLPKIEPSGNENTENLIRPRQLILQKPTRDIEFRRPILETLVEFGGQARVPQVIDAVGRKMKGKLKPIDYERLSSGPVRWESAAKWERQHCVQEGLIEKFQPGIWKISTKGIEWLKQAQKEDADGKD